MKTLSWLTLGMILSVALGASAYANTDTNADDDTWYQTFLGKPNTAEYIKINYDSIARHPMRDGFYTSAWIERRHEHFQKTNFGTNYAIDRTHWLTDCANDRYLLDEISWHDAKGKRLDGATKSVNPSTATDWTVVIAGKPDYDVYQWICWMDEVKTQDQSAM